MNESIQQTIELADELYLHRKEIRCVGTSIDLLEKVSAYETDWRLGRAFFFLGQQADSQKEARDFHQKGIIAARRATFLEANSVEGHFWLGVNLGLAAEGTVSLSALRSALKARSALRKAIAIDGSYHAAGPWRVFAKLNHKAPVLIGTKATALHAYEKALTLAPDSTVTKIYFAELLLELRQSERAKRLLESILAASDDPDWAFEIDRDKTLASKILRTLD